MKQINAKAYIVTILISCTAGISTHRLYAQAPLLQPAQPTSVDSLARAHALDSLLHWRASDSLHTPAPLDSMNSLRRWRRIILGTPYRNTMSPLRRRKSPSRQLYPDPQITGGLTTDITPVPADQKFGNVWSIGASETILLGGKIGARKDVAEQNANTAQAQTEVSSAICALPRRRRISRRSSPIQRTRRMNGRTRIWRNSRASTKSASAQAIWEKWISCNRASTPYRRAARYCRRMRRGARRSFNWAI